MKSFKNKKTLQIVLLVVIAVVTLGIGYAAISAVNLIINGNATARVDQNNFKVHFTQAQSITGTTGVSGTSSIDSEDDTKAMFDVTGLTKVGDYAEAVYTVKNDSNGIGAEITLNLTSSNTEYFKVTETILDNKLQAGDSTTAKVRVEMIKTPVNYAVSTSITATLTASPLEDAEATGGSPASKASDDPVSFATDSWATIQKAVQDNNTSAYHVGDTKVINVTNYGEQTIRISNMTNDSRCNNENYSQTACGFVIEFSNILDDMKMNTTNSYAGGYPATLVYDFLKNSLPSYLPSDLQTVIIDTRVISGGCRTDTTNYITYDKLYLLSDMEIFGRDGNYYDKASSTTWKLDYYNDPNITEDMRLKRYNNGNGNVGFYWYRTADKTTPPMFRTFGDDGLLDAMYDRSGSANGYYNSLGVSPAFRIG